MSKSTSGKALRGQAPSRGSTHREPEAVVARTRAYIEDVLQRQRRTMRKYEGRIDPQVAEASQIGIDALDYALVLLTPPQPRGEGDEEREVA